MKKGDEVRYHFFFQDPRFRDLDESHNKWRVLSVEGFGEGAMVTMQMINLPRGQTDGAIIKVRLSELS